MQKKMLEICTNLRGTGKATPSRHYRDLSAASEAGFDVAAMCKGNPGDKMREEINDGVKVYRCSTRPVKWLPAPINRIISAFQWAGYARRYGADVLNCHNLNAMLIGWLSTFFMGKKAPKLVYNAHEFTVYESSISTKSKIRQFFIKRAEKFFMKRVDLSIMVNDSIAEMTAKIHGLDKKPLVIRSTPENWKIDASEVAEQREKFLSQLPGKTEKSFLAEFHGNINPTRIVETLLRVMAINHDMLLVFIGETPTKEYFNKLVAMTKELGINDRVLFHPFVPLKVLWKYVAAADISIAVIPNVCLNALYSTPNKFFEAIQSLNPYVCSDFPEVGKITREYNIGLTCNPGDINSINEAITRLINDKELYQTFKKNLIKAKNELCWENEKKPLVAAYKKMYDEI